MWFLLNLEGTWWPKEARYLRGFINVLISNLGPGERSMVKYLVKDTCSSL